MKIEDILKGMAFIIEENGSIEYNAKGLKKILDYITTLQRKEYNNSKAIEYIELWHYRNDFRVNSFTKGVKEDLLNILEGDE